MLVDKLDSAQVWHEHRDGVDTMNPQLFFFEQSETEGLRVEIQELRNGITRIRKGQFAKIGSLQKSYDELRNEFEQLKTSICKGLIND